MNQQINMDLNYDRIMEIFITKHAQMLLYCLIIKMIRILCVCMWQCIHACYEY